MQTITLTIDEYKAMNKRIDALSYIAGVVSSIPRCAKREHLKCSLAVIDRKLEEVGVKK